VVADDGNITLDLRGTSKTFPAAQRKKRASKYVTSNVPPPVAIRADPVRRRVPNPPLANPAEEFQTESMYGASGPIGPRRLIRVQWKGYDYHHNSWELAKNLSAELAQEAAVLWPSTPLLDQLYFTPHLDDIVEILHLVRSSRRLPGYISVSIRNGPVKSPDDFVLHPDFFPIGLFECQRLWKDQDLLRRAQQAFR
jgi:hypothetical protein